MRQKTSYISFLLLLVLCFAGSLAFAEDSKKKDSKATVTSDSKITDAKLNKPQGPQNQLSLHSLDWLGSQYVFFLRPSVLESLYPPAPTRPPKMPPLPTDPRELCFYHLRNTGTSFESRVTGCPQLANQILWQQPNGTRVRFNDWTSAQKARINELYDRIQRNVPDLGVRCPVPQDRVNIEYKQIFISAEEAFDMYAAFIAQAIYLEANRLVPWSLLDNPTPENQSILDSSQYFSVITVYREGETLSDVRGRYRPGTAYQSPAWQMGSASLLNCDPRIPYLFLNGTYSATRSNLLGSDQDTTIKNISWWFHENVYHGAGLARENPDWVRGQVFLANRLAQREVSAPMGITRGIESSEGCHSASNLFLELARGINIPIRIFWYLSHGGAPVADFTQSRAHMGIAYHWTRPDARVVLHADDLYVQYKNIFAITPDEHVMSIEATKNIFFNRIWMTVGEAESWGNRYYRPLPLILPGQDINQTLPVRPSSRPDLGYFGAYSHVRTISDGAYVGGSLLNFQREYELCGWPNFLNAYCGDTTEGHANFHWEMQVRARSLPDLSSPLPITSTVDDYMNQASACVRINGGCEALRARIDEESRAHGGSFLRVP